MDLNMHINIAATIAFVAEAHRGQKYGNMPYHFHCVEVASRVDSNGGSRTAIIAGLLHDVIEDTTYTAADLRERYSDDIVDIVVLLTKDPELSYEQNIDRIIDSGNIDAMIVKLSDNQANFHGDKSHMKKERAERLQAKYQKSIEKLRDTIDKKKIFF